MAEAPRAPCECGQLVERSQMPKWQMPATPPSDNTEVVRFSLLFRDIVSTLWDDQTAHPEYRPLPDGMPDSYGQCVPSSCILFEGVSQMFPEEKFTLVSGMVYILGKTVLGKGMLVPAGGAHVWLAWHHASLQHMGLVDVTADQLQSAEKELFPCTIATNEELIRQGVVYQPGRMFADVRELESQFKIREPDVVDRIDLLRDRYEYHLGRTATRR